MRGFFGGSKNMVTAGQSAQARETAATADEQRNGQRITAWPWDGQRDSAACNFAVGHLLTNVPARLMRGGRVHAETCLAALGAIAGFAGQRALFAHLKETKDESLLKQMHTVRTKAGGEYFFGEPLNRMLLPSSAAENNQRLWSLAAGSAVGAGLAPEHLPKVAEMFAYVANTLGGEREGLPSVASEHYPHLPAGELLKGLWPLAMMCFTGRFPKATRQFGVASIKHWPAISARVASTLLQKMPRTLDQRTGLIILMESAIYASKLKPAVLEKVGAKTVGTLH